MDVGNVPIAQRGWGRREGRCLAMFVRGVVRFHTDGGLVSVSLHSSSYQESNVRKPMSCLTLTASY